MQWSFLQCKSVDGSRLLALSPWLRLVRLRPTLVRLAANLAILVDMAESRRRRAVRITSLATGSLWLSLQSLSKNFCAGLLRRPVASMTNGTKRCWSDGCVKHLRHWVIFSSTRRAAATPALWSPPRARYSPAQGCTTETSM